MKSKWMKKREDPKSLTLTDDNPAPVAFYVQWLYHNEVQIKLAEPGSYWYNQNKATPELRRTHIELAQAYTFGERIIDNKYKNAVVLKLLESEQASRWILGPEAAVMIYEGTPAGSPMRRLLADLIANNVAADAS
jgi:hypothetical protein